MVVRELIERLQKIPLETVVVGSDGGSGMMAPHVYVSYKEEEDEFLSEDDMDNFPALEHHPELIGIPFCEICIDW